MEQTTKRTTPTQRALERSRELHGRLVMIDARRVEQVIDRRAGIIFERWLLPNTVSVILRASPEGADAYIEATPGVNSWAATFDKLDEAARLDLQQIRDDLRDAKRVGS